LAIAGVGTEVCGADRAEQAGRVERTRVEVEALMDAKGSKPPDWWYDAKLTYPETLDMNWPLKVEGDWNNQVNVGQYLWDVINPNPGKWQDGIRLVHYLLMRHVSHEQKKARSMEALGRMFHNFNQDWPRAAFWWKLSERFGRPVNQPMLANCYWQMGCEEMARERLLEIGADTTRSGEVIKLWADMGQIDRALKLARVKADAGMPHIAYWAAGNACRQAGQYPDALDYYHKAVKAPLPARKNNDFVRAQAQAKEALDAILLFEMQAVVPLKDGVYGGNSTAFNGPMCVEAKIADGRIVSVRVTEHREKQFYLSLEKTPAAIVERQSLKGIDAVTGATITSQALLNATARALAEALP
jgi:uncharacterized protein with FMN-binding domain